MCRDVVVEPSLLPINDEEVEGTQANRAAPDISSRGLWSTFERAFFDVWVLHPNAPSYSTTDIDKLYKKHEQEKMQKYDSRVISSFHTEKLAVKQKESYSHVLSHMRC